MNGIIRQMGITPERFSELAQPVLRSSMPLIASEAKASKQPTQDRKIEWMRWFEQIKTLSFDKRSKLLDIAIDANAVT
jgi:hypothetical protein